MTSAQHTVRALHYVFRVGNRQKSYDFYTKTLKMHVLRHEEFDQGCAASCNGSYDTRWSKTMIGYGDEKEHFVIEMTYNYGIGSYELGNDYNAIHIESDDVYEGVNSDAKKGPENSLLVHDPDGHAFYVHPGKIEQPVRRMTINVKSLAESKEFWSKTVGMNVVSETKDGVVLTYGPGQADLELKQLPSGEQLKRGTAYGRLAFAYPTADLKEHQERVRKVNAHYIQHEFMELDTPGKATVKVVIMRDPNDHEICYVSDKEFFELSKVDPDGDKLIRDAMSKDTSEKGKDSKAGDCCQK